MSKEPILIGRPPLLRQTNAELLLRLLRETGPCSKADLVRASGLSAPTVTNVVAHLAAAGLVEAIGEGESTGGRPPDILRFRAERGCLTAAEIGPSSVALLVVDLEGRELAQARIPFTWESSSPKAICELIGREVRAVLRSLKKPPEHLLRVVVSVPAIVDMKAGVVASLSKLKDWSDVPLRAMLSRELKCPVDADNDTNLAARGEFARGAARGEKNFVFITIGEGVGAGIFVNGKIYRGARWSAGEIGYLRVPNVSRENPTIHGYGRLEKILGAPGILKSWRASARSSQSRLKVKHATDVFDLAAAGNAAAKRILRQKAGILADVVLDLALILNPGLILLGGEVGNHSGLLREVKGLLAGSEFGVISIKLGELGTAASLWGAVAAGLDSGIAGLLQPAKVAV
ncbi:MAG TPA: ROK family transcriptional regulator [Methylomirabilota bacterium]|nr:ROK family transcriptional regulator [Methylomirabilota bacterium]